MKHALHVTPVLAGSLAAVLAACVAAPTVDESKLIDLTWEFDQNTIYWPTAQRFELERVSHGHDDAGRWYASNDFTASEHGGTHLDAPVHFAEGGRTTADIPIEQCVGPARVIDVRSACDADRDYRVAPEDIERHELEHGPIPPGAIVLVHTGWGRYWPDEQLYLGSAVRGPGVELHFPGLSAAAAEVLVERGIDLVGIDTASLDHGPSTEFGAHRVLGAANLPGLENVAHLERLPPAGATVFALPMKIAAGTGGPVRIVALLP
jgi:kynurenine formamidase